MVGMKEELQEKAKIMRSHTAHTRFTFLRYAQAMQEKNRHKDNAPGNTAIGHRHTSALDNGGKMKIVKSIWPLKWPNKKFWWRFASANTAIQIVSKHDIRDPDIMVNLVWANTYISGHAMHNSVGIVAGNSWALYTSLCIFAPQLASIH